MPPDVQIKGLLRKKYYKEAIYLVEELDAEGELTKEMLSFVLAQVGFLLLFDLQFEDAVNHFLLPETMRSSDIFPFIVHDPNRWSQVLTSILHSLFNLCFSCDLITCSGGSSHTLMEWLITKISVCHCYFP